MHDFVRHADTTDHQRKLEAVSFAGCAWLLTYHFGVAHALERAGVLSDATVYLGASSGSIVAVALAAGLEPRACHERTRACARRVEGRLLGPLGRMTQIVRWALEGLLPEDAHRRVAGRFFASITHLPRMRNRLAPEGPLHSREELIQLVLASCYIPLYYERPSVFRGAFYIDGGITDNQPRYGERTLTVSPMPKTRLSAHVRPNASPPLRDVFFPSDQRLCALFDDGVRDAEQYLRLSRL